MATHTKKVSRIYHKDDVPDSSYARVAAWFLGPKGENVDVLVRAIETSIRHHATFRKEHYNTNDPEYITADIKTNSFYKEAIEKFERNLEDLRNRLTYSVPFFTPRYQAHMDWDLAIPALAGYVTAMLYNQNNVATEASTVTSMLEMDVGKDLCGLLGFKTTGGKTDPWGHITCGGTVANIESMWVARNLKYMPLAIKMLLITNDKYKNARGLKISVWPTKVEKEFISLYMDELLRLDPDLVLSFVDEIGSTCDIPRDEVTADITPLTLQYLGYCEFGQKHGIIMRSPKVLVPATRHYSWPKAGTLLGLGEDAVIGVKVDKNCRMDLDDLREKISYCKRNNHTILMVVAVLGSTAEGICDDLFNILIMRSLRHWEEMNYLIHVDAAWGGYIRAMLPEMNAKTNLNVRSADEQYVPTLSLSHHAQRQLRVLGFADSITVDPHKAGYVPYPAGALCYRNGDFRYIINMGAPYIKSDEDTNVGTYGVEGSKPGAAPAAVWLAHRSISLDNQGYGMVLGQCMFSVKRYYCEWLMLPQRNDPFVVSMIHAIPEMTHGYFKGKSETEIKAYIKKNIIGKTNKEISQNKDSMHLLSELGPDVLINAFVFNYYKPDGTLNTDVNKIQELTDKLLERFCMTQAPDVIQDISVLIMGNEYSSTAYANILDRVSKELGYDQPQQEYSLKMVNSTILNPWPTSFEFLAEVTSAFREGLIEIIQEMNKKR